MHFFSPMEINSINVCSRIFFAPINPGFAIGGSFSKLYIDFFVKRSGPLIGICYIGNVALDINTASNTRTAVLDKNKDLKWKKLNDTISNKGSLSGIQIAWKPEEMLLQRDYICNEKEKQIEYFNKFYNDFNDYDEVTDKYVNSIKKAIDVGFSVIQIHAAHGYALSLLLSRSISSCDNPADTKGIRLLQQIMDRVKNYSKQTIYDIRISLYEGICDNDLELEYKSKLFCILKQQGFNIISLSNGFYNIDKNMIYPRKSDGTVILEEAIDFATKNIDVVWNVAGNMEYILKEKKQYPNNLTISLGRQLICDPHTLDKIKKNRFEKIEYCKECNNCHYYSLGFNGIQECKKER